MVSGSAMTILAPVEGRPAPTSNQSGDATPAPPRSDA
jgi:hypothetical protein